MSRISYRLATHADIAGLIPRLRQRDIDECEAMFGPDSMRWAAWLGMEWGALVAECDGEVIAAFGVVPSSDDPQLGIPWMFGTDRIDECSRQLLRDPPRVLRVWLRHFTRLENYVDARNVKSVRWLRRLGFTVHAPEPMGVAGLPFHRFQMSASQDRIAISDLTN